MSAGTMADEFVAQGCAIPARQEGRPDQRLADYAALLADAGKPDVPDLYVSRNYEYF